MPKKTYVKGFEGLERSLSKYGERVEKEMRDHVNVTAQKIRKEATDLIQHGVKTGKIYKKYQPKRQHQASSKYQSPATDTGHLVSNIKATFKGKRAKVTSRARYSNHLELTLKRPFMIPAMEYQRKYWNNGILNIIKYKNRKGRK